MSDTQDPKSEKKRRLARALRQNLGNRKKQNQYQGAIPKQSEHSFDEENVQLPVVKTVSQRCHFDNATASFLATEDEKYGPHQH